MRELLFLAHRLPYPPNKGDKIRSWHMLQYLSRHFHVHLGCFIDDDDDWQHAKTVAALCASTRFIDLRRGPARWRAMQALLSRQAMSVQYYRDTRLLQWVDGLLSSGKVRHALAFSGPMAQYIDGSAGRALHRVIDFVDVDSDKWRQYGDSKPWPMSQLYRREAQLLLQYERHIAQQFTAASFVSPAEAALFRQCAPMARRKTGYFNNGVDTAYFTPMPPQPGVYPAGVQTLVFTGAMDYWPNVDAVQWFVRHVWPALRRQFPQLQFYIVGSAPVPAVTALARVAGVVVTGKVPDIRPYLAGAALAVAPLRIARGVQNKVLEAMAMGKIVLATPQALEGIAAQPGLELLLARDDVEFIHHAARVLRNAQSGAAEGSGAAIGAAARQLVLQDYDWERNLHGLGAMLGLPAAAEAATSGAATPLQPVREPST
ncbi:MULTISPECIES: TIGR03087 family PEP-CTERM/XrtA system glycosyltransferase [unclassified Janthinobacterium]|uniref:TIGR03087 family PEP-CTERM/XrtA system glycosyltransferase n=1 Tax=unclassified Janthinobacterium TaxID=2610881 RepID=UPI001E2CC74D|nr:MULTISPECIES: TIGR03087 family PEP-CTERM/XrtA system glycosyltransferase [unclassified Janthinobacterium]MCC7641872.1 TIGR03087 family PEP-CTERM/XrtA system glycosyltransferase [Janthinobacterium sp. EB271-G4-3-1]MCC7689998.1 TIGR03087 family PEP-CTERM/XrtA system glycosyltransferase [Janthinobacterium sp. EB271-G4-3-2]